jgi:membrane protease YdiL (CAAX protease family)
VKPRPLAALAAVVLVPWLAGSAVAPLAAAWIVPLLDRLFPGGSFAAPDFSRVLSRCVMIAAIAILPAVVRLSGLATELRSAFRPDRARLRRATLAALLGLSMILAAYGLGWALAGYRVSDDIHGFRHGLRQALAYVPGALFIAFFEEAFFRGLVYGGLRKKLPVWPAALLAALFFAALHFMRAPVPAGFDTSRWYAGFAMTPHVFDGLVWARDGVFFLALLIMSVLLALRYEHDGHLWVAVGLHGGWVWALQFGAFAFDRNWAFLGGLLGSGDYVSRAPLALLVLGAGLAVELRRRLRG